MEDVKKKCYIAGKIGDLKPEEYQERFAQAEKEVMALGFDPVSPLKLPHKHGRSWAEYMREDLTAMLQCDAVYALSNSGDSRGATIEIELAEKVGIGIIRQRALATKTLPKILWSQEEIKRYNEWYNSFLGYTKDKCFVHFKMYDPGGKTWRCDLCGIPGVDDKPENDGFSETLKYAKEVGHKSLMADLTEEKIKEMLDKDNCVIIKGQSISDPNKKRVEVRLTGHVYDRSLNMKGEQWFCECGKFAAEEIL